MHVELLPPRDLSAGSLMLQGSLQKTRRDPEEWPRPLSLPLAFQSPNLESPLSGCWTRPNSREVNERMKEISHEGKRLGLLLLGKMNHF